MSGSPSQSKAGQPPYTPPSDRDKPSTPTSSILGKRRRACEHCRSSKAKCIFENESDATCKNCAKTKRQCVIEHDKRFPTHPREGHEKRAKKDRHDITGSWKGLPETRAAQEDGAQLDPSKAQRSYGAIFPFLFPTDNQASAPASSSERGTATPASTDVIDRGFLSVATAEKCFSYFVNQQAHRAPWIGFPVSPSFSLCRVQNPFLFLAILSAGSGSDPSDLQSRLIDEFYKIMAEMVVYRSQKRSDIVHAILICTFWTPPPERLEDLRYSANVHLATSIALDVLQVSPGGPGDVLQPGGIGRGPVLHGPPKYGVLGKPNDGSGHIDNWRLILACFASCSMLALTLKRTSIMRFNDRIEKALEKLLDPEASLPDTAMKDNITAKWIRLHHIEEELAEAKDTAPNDGGKDTNIAIMKRLLAASFEARLIEWRKSLSDQDEKSETLMVEYHFMQLQAAMLGVSDSKQQLAFPFTRDQIAFPSIDIKMVAKSVSAAKSILNLFLSIDAADIPSLPSILFPRLIYSMMTLVKATSTMTDLHDKELKLQEQEATRSKGEKEIEMLKSNPGKYNMEDVKSMKVVEYCDQVIDLLHRAAGPKPGRSGKIIGLMTLLRKWYHKSVLGEVDTTAVPKITEKPGPAKQFQAGIPVAAVRDAKGTATFRSNTIPAAGMSFNAVNLANSPSSNNNSYQGNTTTGGSSPDGIVRRHGYLTTLPQAHPSPSFSTSMPAMLNEIDQSTNLRYPDTAMYSMASTGFPFGDVNIDTSRIGPGIGIDGIPPLNAFEETQYGFLDALLGPGSGGVPFGSMNDAMAGFGWM